MHRSDSAAPHAGADDAVGDAGSERKLSGALSQADAASGGLAPSASAPALRGRAGAQGTGGAKGKAVGHGAPSPISRPLSGRERLRPLSRGRDGPAGTGAYARQMAAEAEERAARVAQLRPVEGPIAGYEPAVEAVDERTLEEAREMLRDPAGVRAFVASADGQRACARAGVEQEELRARPLSDFRVDARTNTVLPPEMQQRRFDSFNSRRAFKLGLVLVAARKMEDTAEEAAARRNAEMRGLFAKALSREQRRLQKIERDRLKRQTVLERENELLLQRRGNWDVRKQHIQKRYRSIEAMRARQREEQRQRAERAEGAVAAAQAAREQQEADKRAEAEARAEERAARTAKFLEDRARQAEANRAREEERQRRRERVRKQSEEQLKSRRHEILGSVARKEQQVRARKSMRRSKARDEQEDRFLRAISRKDNAQRIRREKEFRKRQLADRMKENYKKMEMMRDLRRAIEIQRDEDAHMEIITRDDWKARTVLQRNVTPGPGEYDAEEGLDTAGGVWGKYKPKSDIDWVIYKAKQLPGPGQYDVSNPFPVTGGTWGKYRPKSDLEWQIYHAKQLPGPGEYEPPRDTSANVRLPSDTPGPTPGGRVLKGRVMTAVFGTEKRDSSMDQLMRRAAQVPGPGTYGGPRLPSAPPRLSDLTRRLGAHEEVQAMTGEPRLPRRRSVTDHKDTLARSAPGRAAGSPLARSQDSLAFDYPAPAGQAGGPLARSSRPGTSESALRPASRRSADAAGGGRGRGAGAPVATDRAAEETEEDEETEKEPPAARTAE